MNNVEIENHILRFAKELLGRAGYSIKKGCESKVFLKEIIFDIVNTLSRIELVDKLRLFVQPIRRASYI